MADSDPQQDLPAEMPEGASVVPKAPSEEELRETRSTHLEESLKPIREAEVDTKTEDDEE